MDLESQKLVVEWVVRVRCAHPDSPLTAPSHQPAFTPRAPRLLAALPTPMA